MPYWYSQRIGYHVGDRYDATDVQVPQRPQHPLGGDDDSFTWSGSVWVQTGVQRPWPVLKLTALKRIETAGKLQALADFFTANPLLKMKWDASVSLTSNDPQITAVISGTLGLDPVVILAVDRSAT